MSAMSEKDQPSSPSLDVSQVLHTHQRWLKRLLGLGALEAKIWVATSAQLLALMCAAAVLLVTTWLLLIAAAAAMAWSYGFSLAAVLSVGAVMTLVSGLGLLILVKRTLNALNFTRTLDALIPPTEDE